MTEGEGGEEIEVGGLGEDNGGVSSIEGMMEIMRGQTGRNGYLL